MENNAHKFLDSTHILFVSVAQVLNKLLVLWFEFEDVWISTL